jgi:AraC family transcriptional regulator, regulatory protein of adaptative response / methylated-DNA-[protein]-cysteine methyltransferase
VGATPAIRILAPMNRTDVTSTPRDFRRIERAIEFVADHFRSQPSLEEIAAAAGISEYHFARVFRQWAGISPKQLVQRLSLEAAKQSLGAEASVLQAALDAGLSGPGRLHDLFVSLEAVTPGEFKSRGAGLTIRHGMAETPFGTARIAATNRGVAFLGFADGAGQVAGWPEFQRDWRDAAWVEDDASARRVARTVWGLAPAGGRRLTLWVHGSNFQIQVWRALLAKGGDATLSYEGLASAIGRPNAARAVGTAVGSNPVAWLIPCHHVLRKNGALGGYRWGIGRKRAMLAWEVARSVRSASPSRRPSPSRVSA